MAFEVNYSAIDRLLHRFAFSSSAVQRGMADIEDSAFGKFLGKYRAGKPVFITSLPRAGTTLLLEIFAKHATVATHTYRDMPFVLAPVLWSRVSRPFGRKAETRERAHGDGIEIGFDSPEAFEEVFWRTFWPDKYDDRKILLWDESDHDADAVAFLEAHMRKIVALRRTEAADDGRYFSKNNANIARLRLLARMFPDGRIVVPYRDPLQHAASLLRQHWNFVELHNDDAFVYRYMKDIGHLEFGALHRPIAFPDLERQIAAQKPDQLGYWLGYWVAAFRHIQSLSEHVVLVDYDSLCRDGTKAMRQICSRLDLAPDPGLDAAARRLRDPTRHAVDTAGLPGDLVDRAYALHAALEAA